MQPRLRPPRWTRGTADDSCRYLSRRHLRSWRPRHGGAATPAGRISGGGVRHQRPGRGGTASAGHDGGPRRHVVALRDRSQIGHSHPAASRGVVDHIGAHGGQRHSRKRRHVACRRGRGGHAGWAGHADDRPARLRDVVLQHGLCGQGPRGAGRIARALRPRRHRHPGDAGHYRRGFPDGHQWSPAQPVGAGTGGSMAADADPAQDLDPAGPRRDAVTVWHRDGIGARVRVVLRARTQR